MSPKREATIWLTIGAGIVAILGAGFYEKSQEEARPWCYENIDAFYTWRELRPLVDKTVADEFITNRECENLKAAHNEAETRQNRRIYLAKYKK